MGNIYIDGVGLDTFGVVASSGGTYNAPIRDISEIEVLGRSGTLIRDNGRYKNVPISYPCYIARDFPEHFDALKNYLLSRRGYFRLEDSYDTTHYRRAYFAASIEPNTTALNRGAEFNLTFSAMPQRFRTDGETYREAEVYEGERFHGVTGVEKVLYLNLPQYVKDVAGTHDNGKEYAHFSFSNGATANELRAVNSIFDNCFICACNNSSVVVYSNGGYVFDVVPFSFNNVYIEFNDAVELHADSKLAATCGLSPMTFLNATTNECSPLYRFTPTTNAAIDGCVFTVNSGAVLFNNFSLAGYRYLYIDSDSYYVYAETAYGQIVPIQQDKVKIIGSIRCNAGENMFKVFNLYPFGNVTEILPRWYDL